MKFFEVLIFFFFFFLRRKLVNFIESQIDDQTLQKDQYSLERTPTKQKVESNA